MAFRGDLEALILGVLQAQPMHGYEIAKQIKAVGSDALAFGEGQLYPALHRLERDGFISAVWVPQEGKPDRKVYALTDIGNAELVEKKRHWEEFAKGVARVLSAPKPAKGAANG